MIYGVGIDIIEVSRVRAVFKRHGSRAKNRILTKAEQAQCRRRKDPSQHIAGLFAAKEAVLKAIGIGFARGARWRDIEIRPDALGRPIVHLSGKTALEAKKRNIAIFHLSISHTAEHAVAQVVAAKGAEPARRRKGIKR